MNLTTERILDNMVFNDGDTLKVNQFILPKVEAEVAFVLKMILPDQG